LAHVLEPQNTKEKKGKNKALQRLAVAALVEMAAARRPISSAPTPVIGADMQIHGEALSSQPSSSAFLSVALALSPACNAAAPSSSASTTADSWFQLRRAMGGCFDEPWEDDGC